MNKERFGHVFPLGTHLCREPMPAMSEMKRDMELIRRNGFNLVKLQENWMLDEPEEGRFDFSRYEELLDHAARLDLGVYLGLTCEQAPNWLWRKHPDARMIGRNGLPVSYQAQSTLPADGKPGPCYDHPGAMEDQLRFIRRLVQTLGRYENIVVWNTWQEIGYWPEMFTGTQVCFCPHTLAAYRQWLSDCYGGDIDRLNRHWNVRYPAFEDILPEMSARRSAVPQEFHFHYFMDNVQTARVLQARHQAIRESDPLNRPVFAHKGGPAFAAGTDWTYARTQDFLGTSCYPAWGCGHAWDDHRQGNRLERHDALLAEMWDGLAYRMDHIRCANRPDAPIWAAVFQGGPISTEFHIGRKPDAADMRRWMLTTLGAGATAISFWVTRAEIMAPETNGFALLDSEGEETERMREAARIGQAVQRHADLFARNNTRQADVAILVDEWRHQMMRSLQFAPEMHAYDIRGWYRLLMDAGIPCDLVEAGYLQEPRMAGYKVLIVPMALSMSEDVARSLAAFAEAGGHVVLEAAPGRLDESAFAVRGEMNPVLRNLLHVDQKTFTLVREPGDRDRWSQPERTWGEYAEACVLEGTGCLAGERLRANGVLQTFRQKSGAEEKSQVVLRYGEEIAGVKADHGRGALWLLGTYAGPSGTAYRDPANQSAVVLLMRHMGVRAAGTGRLLVRKRGAANKEAWFFTNPHREVVTEEVVIPQGWMAEELLGESMANRLDRVVLTVGPLDVRVLVLTKEQGA